MDDKSKDYELNRITGIVLKNKRLQRNYSLEDLSKKLNKEISKQALNKYEQGESRVKNQMFQKICKALGYNPEIVWEEIINQLYENEPVQEITQITKNEFKQELESLLSRTDIDDEKKEYIKKTIEMMCKDE